MGYVNCDELNKEHLARNLLSVFLVFVKVSALKSLNARNL